MEKMMLSKEELMELKTSHKVIESYNAAEGYTYDPTDTTQAALNKLYNLERLIDQDQCFILAAPIGVTVYLSSIIDKRTTSVESVPVTYSNCIEITEQWGRKYFATYAEAHQFINSRCFKEDEIVQVSDDNKYFLLRHYYDFDPQKGKYITYPMGYNQEMYHAMRNTPNYLESADEEVEIVVTYECWKYIKPFEK